MNQLTRILSAAGRGDPNAAAQLLPLVYQVLRDLAARRIAAERPGQTLQATALVHEAYVRVVEGDAAKAWDGRWHFFAAAAEAMRRILVEQARRRGRIKRGGGTTRCRIDLEDVDLAVNEPRPELLAVDEALSSLEVPHPEKAQLVKLRYFAGLTTEQAAEAMGISVSTANRHWSFARAWLFRHLDSK
jgi:RNA polymerase sigma factor (TIGR02999 family)